LGVEVDSADVNLNRGEGLAPGLSMNMCAEMVAGTVLEGAFAGWNSYYLEELFSALLLFALVALPLLALAFSLAMVEAGAERGMPWAKARSGELAAPLRGVRKPAGSACPFIATPLPLSRVPRDQRVLQTITLLSQFPSCRRCPTG